MNVRHTSFSFTNGACTPLIITFVSKLVATVLIGAIFQYVVNFSFFLKYYGKRARYQCPGNHFMVSILIFSLHLTFKTAEKILIIHFCVS